MYNQSTRGEGITVYMEMVGKNQMAMPQQPIEYLVTFCMLEMSF